MDLKQVTEQTYYIPGLTNIGIYRKDEQITLIDSGNDESAGRKIFRLLEKEGWYLKTILNTHSNADHIGGNQYLQKKTGCEIIATSMESTFIEYPYLEPLLLWGATPFKSLRNKFLQAKPSQVTSVISDEGSIGKTGLEALPLPGHFLQMIGVKTPDNVCFLADSLFSPTILAKYKITVCTDVSAMLQTYSYLEKLEGSFFIPSHAEPTENIRELIQINRDNLFEINQLIQLLCNTPLSREEILSRIVLKYNIQLSSSQFVLTLITISAHLSYLFDKEIIQPVFENGKMLWHTKTFRGAIPVTVF